MLAVCSCSLCFFFFSSRRRHTRLQGDWSSDVCSSDLVGRSTADSSELKPARNDNTAERCWLCSRSQQRHCRRQPGSKSSQVQRDPPCHAVNDVIVFRIHNPLSSVLLLIGRGN